MKLFVFAFFTLAAILACKAAIAPQARIAGGDDVIAGQIPYQAAVFFAGSPLCGATILSENYVLTALYCVCSAGSYNPWPPQIFSVVAGSADLYTGRSDVRVEEIIVNPNYSDWDTAMVLLKLATPFVFSERIQPIALSKQNPPVGAELEISGWGRLKTNDENMHRTLQINEAEVMDEAECNRVLGKQDDQVICMSHARKNGICRGDYGGPVVYQGKLVGMSAYVLGECGSILPDVATSIAKNYEWIIDNMTA